MKQTIWSFINVSGGSRDFAHRWWSRGWLTRTCALSNIRQPIGLLGIRERQGGKGLHSHELYMPLAMTQFLHGWWEGHYRDVMKEPYSAALETVSQSSAKVRMAYLNPLPEPCAIILQASFEPIGKASFSIQTNFQSNCLGKFMLYLNKNLPRKPNWRISALKSPMSEH